MLKKLRSLRLLLVLLATLLPAVIFPWNATAVALPPANGSVQICSDDGNFADHSPTDPEKAKIKKTVAQRLLLTTKYLQEQEYLSDWQALGLARAGKKAPEKYLASLKDTVRQCQGSFRRVTDYERLTLTATAVGLDPQNLAGYDLLEKIYNYERIDRQGVNGAIFALIALDSGNYPLSREAKWSREKIIEIILSYQNQDGGFGLSPKTASDVDLTAMALQALSPYQEQSPVAAKTALALKWLSARQTSSGGYCAWGKENSESTAQVIIALTALGIDPQSEPFVKAHGTLLSNLLSYGKTDGSFCHIQGGDSNGMATEQACLALTAYDRYLRGQNKLYLMTAEPQQE